MIETVTSEGQADCMLQSNPLYLTQLKTAWVIGINGQMDNAVYVALKMFNYLANVLWLLYYFTRLYY